MSQPGVTLQNQSVAGILEAGVDEVGRGCLFGPVVCAAVILPEGFEDAEGIVKDSKKLTEKRRKRAVELIKDSAIAWAVCFVGPAIIDRHNIYQANARGMVTAVKELRVEPEHVVVDGDRFPGAFLGRGGFIRHTCVVKGDASFRNVAAASILAKEARDEYIRDLSVRYPLLDDWYGMSKHVGYCTRRHQEGIRTRGITHLHRLSFRTCQGDLPVTTLPDFPAEQKEGMWVEVGGVGVVE